MTSATLLLWCAGPMQSWGISSRFGERDTAREPSKSGVLGLIAAALGRQRVEPLEDLAALRQGLRVDRPGHVEVDFQTALGVAKASGASPETAVSRRRYLADACFLVGLEGDRKTLERAHTALRSPRWPLFLGRRGYAPGLPPYVPEGLVEGALEGALQSQFWPSGEEGPLEAVIECLPGEPGDLRRDVPLSFVPHDRRYGERRVRRVLLQPPAREA